MTGDRFDELTKALGKTASRRTVFKGVVAAALGGALMRVRGDGEAEATRSRRACSRLHEVCGGATPTTN